MESQAIGGSWVLQTTTLLVMSQCPCQSLGSSSFFPFMMQRPKASGLKQFFLQNKRTSRIIKMSRDRKMSTVCLCLLCLKIPPIRGSLESWYADLISQEAPMERVYLVFLVLNQAPAPAPDYSTSWASGQTRAVVAPTTALW